MVLYILHYNFPMPSRYNSFRNDLANVFHFRVNSSQKTWTLEVKFYKIQAHSIG